MSDYKLTLQSHNSNLQELINMANELPDKVEGVQLNFEVVGGLEQPTNPTENMIWVETDVAITSYVFSATEPEGYAPGMVWITTDTSSPVAFNALKKNGIQVYPISAKQCISGALVDKTAKIYSGAKWCEFISPIVVLRFGANPIDLTGGFDGTNATKESNAYKFYRPGYNGNYNTTSKNYITTTIERKALFTVSGNASGEIVEISIENGQGVAIRTTVTTAGTYTLEVPGPDKWAIHVYLGQNGLVYISEITFMY
jgi:hypothetical protein